jgi:GDP-D-mannose dehydratase
MSKQGLYHRHRRAGCVYLVKFFPKKVYEVHGIKQRSSAFAMNRVNQLYQNPYAEDCRFAINCDDMGDSCR